ncbi:MAG: serine/threonine protein kinase [Adhaeribacter sp.]
MIKYRLSKSISISHPNEDCQGEVPLQFQEGHFVLIDEFREKEFLINETIKYFIEKFTLPKTQAEVLQEVAFDLKSEATQIERKCVSFLNLLRRKKIIVPEYYEEKKLERQMALKPGDELGDYRIEASISNKKCIDIYLARDKNTQKQYAIKLLNRGKIGRKKHYLEELSTLKHEYHMLQKARHIPGVCQAFEMHADEEKNAYIRLEYISGKPLGRFLKQQEKLDLVLTLHLMRQIVGAFAGLHACQVIHGDVHPSNILVNEDLSIKVIDLGLSLPEVSEANEMVRFGGVIYYMPPERINISSNHKFSREPDFLSDVYQIGLILYYLLYRQEPFAGFIWEELSGNIKKNKIDFPALSFQGFPVPEGLIQIIRRCTAKNQNNRYPTAAAVLADLQKFALTAPAATI